MLPLLSSDFSKTSPELGSNESVSSKNGYTKFESYFACPVLSGFFSLSNDSRVHRSLEVAFSETLNQNDLEFFGKSFIDQRL